MRVTANAVFARQSRLRSECLMRLRLFSGVATNSVHVSKTLNGSASSSLAYDEDKIDATILVDNLLEYTHSLMTGKASNISETKGDRHREESSAAIIAPLHHIIAFSGGIDSSVATALAHQIAETSLPDHTVTAALGISPAVPQDQIVLAEQVAQHIGVDLQQIHTTEGDDSTYIANEGKACLACKTHLYTCLSSIVEHYGGVDAGSGDGRSGDNADNTMRQSLLQLYNGTNADDLQDPTRLGLIAANNYNVKSPLEHTPKHLVRIAGKHLGLPNWNYAASPCLRSRMALGVEAIPQHLQKIEQAETFVRSALQLDPTVNMRVRLLAGNKAMIEVDTTMLTRVEDAISDNDKWKETFVENLGFSSLDVRGFKTGSVAKR